MWLKIGSFLVVTALAASLTRTLWLSYQSRQQLSQQQQRVEQLESEADQLAEEVHTATSSFTLEKRAREDLQLHRNGEMVLPIKW